MPTNISLQFLFLIQKKEEVEMNKTKLTTRDFSFSQVKQNNRMFVIENDRVFLLLKKLFSLCSRFQTNRVMNTTL